MFKRSENKQIDLFKNIGSHLCSRKNKVLSDPCGWHNVFWNQVTSRIDEEPYSILYDEKMGRPNASIRVLIGMMILKEGNGWSDEQLFDESRFNLKVMQALGFSDIDQDVPVESTYYELRRLMAEHFDCTGEDLIQYTFTQITTDQVVEFNISGKKIRLDSKLIQSNIAKSNRLQLILEAVRVSIRHMEISLLKDQVSDGQYTLLEQLCEQTTSNITYTLNKKDQEEMLIDLGYIIKAIIKIGDNNRDSLLKRIYTEQYEEGKEAQIQDDQIQDSQLQDAPNDQSPPSGEPTITPKLPQDISSSSVQSIHDPEAAYRKKGKEASTQTVSGYHANITETCDEDDSINLITSVEVVPANVCENEFLLTAIDQTEQVLGGKEKQVEQVITDGGYDSVENRKAMVNEDKPKWSLAKLKGRQRAYEMEFTKQGELKVKDKKTSEQCEVSYSEKAKKYRIKTKQGLWRYMTKEQVLSYINSQTIMSQSSTESYNLRSNVESTIHQTFHRIKKRQKIVYRRLIKCQWYVLLRVMWVNMTRISKNLQEISQFFINWSFPFPTMHHNSQSQVADSHLSSPYITSPMFENAN